MASSRFYTVVNFLLIWLLFKNNVSISQGNGPCLNPKFKENQKIVIEYFFDAENGGLDSLCDIVNNSNGLISIVYKMGAEVTKRGNGDLYCGRSTPCTEDRLLACMYLADPKAYNSCTYRADTQDIDMADCVCAKKSDKILLDNGAARSNYKIPIDDLPTIAVAGKYDPCFDTTSFDKMKAYFCKAYDTKLPICNK